MTSRERVLEAINLREPDRVPTFITVVEEVARRLSEQLGIDLETVADSPLSKDRISYHEPLIRLGNDIVGIGACAPDNVPTVELGGGFLVDEWKVKYRRAGYYTEMIEHPLSHAETVADVEGFPFPDPLAAGRFRLASRCAQKYGERYALCGDVECTIFEGSWHLTGLEKFLMDLAAEKDYVFALMDKIAEYSIGVGNELLLIGADILWLGDDLGMQHGMMISPSLWRRHLKDRLRKVISAFRTTKPEVKIAYHSCGSFRPVIPDLIEIGVDILNALQPTAQGMNIAQLKREFGSRVAFFGGLDTQQVLPFGSIDDVRKDVRRVIAAAAAGGGLIVAGAHNLQPDTSAAKILAIYEAIREYGRYARPA